MAISIYKSANPGQEFSVSGVMDNPLAIACDGVNGTTISRKYFVRSDIADQIDITLQPVVGYGTNIVDGTDGFGWKLLAGNEQPLEEQWDAVAYGNTINIPDLTTTTQYEPFWLRVVTPRGAPVTTYENVNLRITYTDDS